MGSTYKGTGGIVDLESLIGQLEAEAVGDTVRRHKYPFGPDLRQFLDSNRPCGIHFRDNVWIVDQITENGERALLREFQGKVDGVADAKAHAEMVGHADLHLLHPCSRNQTMVRTGNERKD
jgi:hypothetical protein